MSQIVSRKVKYNQCTCKCMRQYYNPLVPLNGFDRKCLITKDFLWQLCTINTLAFIQSGFGTVYKYRIYWIMLNSYGFTCTIWTLNRMRLFVASTSSILEETVVSYVFLVYYFKHIEYSTWISHVWILFY